MRTRPLPLAGLAILLPLLAATAPRHAAAAIALTALPGLNGTLSNAIAFVDPDDGLPHRLLAAQTGQILVWDAAGVRATPFLDLRDDLSVPVAQRKVNYDTAERGLLALAVDPHYRSNGFFYVYYTAIDFDGGGPIQSGDIVVERYHVSSDPQIADPASGQVVLTISHGSAGNHNGGWLAFGPTDGYLYISTGDGGGGCDSSGPGPTGPPNALPQGNSSRTLRSQYNGTGQDPSRVLLGKLLRVDPSGDDFPSDGLRNYAVPASNPLAEPTEPVTGKSEIWAFGLRNPFRFSFDRATGDLWIADVGQNKWEEVDLRPASSTGGESYGWSCREGLVASGGGGNPSACSQSNCPVDSSGLIDPLVAEDHSNGWCAIIGGYRYRGTQAPSIAGNYLYSDNCLGDVYQGAFSAGWSFSPLLSAPGGVFSFGQDHLGELYVVNGGSGTVSCIENGKGCFWALWHGFGEDSFESGDVSHWHASAP